MFGSRGKVEQVFADETCRSGLAEGVGLEPTSPSGQRFSSVWPGVLTGPTYFCPRLFVQVSEKTTT